MPARRGSIVLVLLAALAILAGTGALLLSQRGRKGPDAGAGIERRALRRDDGRAIAEPAGGPDAGSATGARPAGLRSASDPDRPPVVEFPAALLLRVLTAADRKPVAGARVEVRDLGSVSSGSSDEGGRMLFPRLEAGTVIARVRADGFCGEQKSVVLGQRDGVQEEEVLLWPVWTIEGTVVSAADGRPLPRARVRTVSGDRGPLDGATTTDDRGRFSFQAGRHGDGVTVAAEAWGHLRRETGSTEGTVSPEGTLRFDIELDPEADVRGVVRDPSGRPVAADVLALVPGAEPTDPDAAWSYIRLEHLAAARTTSDSDGSFRLRGLAAGGLYRVVAAHRSHGPSTEGDRVLAPADGSELRLDLSLRLAGGLDVTLRDAATGEVCFGDVFVHPAGVDPVANANRLRGGGGHGYIVKSPGVHRYEPLPPGRYRVMGSGDASAGETDATVVPGEVAAVEVLLRLHPVSVSEGPPEGEPSGIDGPDVGGMVFDASGTDLDQDGEARPAPPSLRLEPVLPRGLSPRPGSLYLEFRPREEESELISPGDLFDYTTREHCSWNGGAVEIRVAGPGTGDLFVVTEGFVLGPIQVEVPRSGRVDLGRRELLDGCTIEGRVLDRQGRPIRRATVSGSAYDVHTGQTTTGRDGGFVLPGNFAGDVRVNVRAPGFQDASLSAESGPGSAPLEIRLSRWGTVRVRARDASGVPLAGWCARIVPVDAAGEPPLWNQFLDALGRVEFRVGAGAWRVEVRRDRAGGEAGAEASADAIVQDEGVTVVDLTGAR